MGWYEAVKDLATVADRLRDAELKNHLAAVRVECSKLAEENAHLRQQLVETQTQLKLRSDMVFSRNAYWRRSPGTGEEGPFCPRCLDGSGRAARMAVRSDDHWWRCPVCDCSIEKPGQNREIETAESDWDPLRQ